MAEHEGVPTGSALHQIAALKNVIAAVEAIAAAEARQVRRSVEAADRDAPVGDLQTRTPMEEPGGNEAPAPRPGLSADLLGERQQHPVHPHGAIWPACRDPAGSHVPRSLHAAPAGDLRAKGLSRGLAVPLVRMDAGPNCAKGVGLVDRAADLVRRIEAARTECRRLCGPPGATTAQQPGRSLRRWIGPLRGR